MLDELQTWWQGVTPETQAAIQDGSLLLGALLGGYILGAMVARGLRAKNFDAALRLPFSRTPGAEADHGFTPTYFAGLLIRLTIWAAAARWLAHKRGWEDLANRLGVITNRTWALAAVLLASLALGSLLARRLLDCLGLAKPDARSGAAGSAAGAVVGGVYGLVVLLVLLVAADLFDWPLTRNSAQALWQFAQHLLIAGAALFIGCLGARWARDLATSDGASTPEKRAGQYTGLGIIAATTVLAVAVLLSSAGVLIGLAALGILGFLLWLARGYLPDVVAGLQLRAHRVREVWFDGEAWQLAEVGFLTTQVCRGGDFRRVQNRVVLEARLHEAPAEAAQR